MSSSNDGILGYLQGIRNTADQFTKLIENINNRLNDLDQRLCLLENSDKNIKYLVNQHVSDCNKRLKLMENQSSKYFPAKFQTTKHPKQVYVGTIEETQYDENKNNNDDNKRSTTTNQSNKISINNNNNNTKKKINQRNAYDLEEMVSEQDDDLLEINLSSSQNSSSLNSTTNNEQRRNDDMDLDLEPAKFTSNNKYKAFSDRFPSNSPQPQPLRSITNTTNNRASPKSSKSSSPLNNANNRKNTNNHNNNRMMPILELGVGDGFILSNNTETVFILFSFSVLNVFVFGEKKGYIFIFTLMFFSFLTDIKSTYSEILNTRQKFKIR